MHFKLVQTKNVQRLHMALEKLNGRQKAIPGLGLLSGPTGAGKTTALVGAVVAFDAVFVRANAATNFTGLLDALCFELSIDSHLRNAAKVDAITRGLRAKPRPLFIDEADYIVRDYRMLEVLRDIHDGTGVPVMLIGMEGIESKIGRIPQVARRIAQHIVFKPCDLADAALIAKELCEVEVAPDLIKKMHLHTNGSIGHIVIALAHFESLAKDNRVKSIDADMWGDKPMFLGDKDKGAL